MKGRILHRVLLALAAFAAPPAVYAEESDPRYPLAGAHVPDNRQASEKFDRTMQLLRSGKTDEAVVRLIELEDEFPDKLVLFGVVGQYVSVRQLVARVTKEMPEAALAQWRKRIDPRVDALLTAAREPRDFRRILRDYPMATRAPEAFLRLEARLWETGDLSGAAEILADLIDLPGTEIHRPAAAARLAMALGSMNDAEAVLQLEAKLSQHLDDPVVLRGRKGKLRETFASARKRLRPDDDAAPAWSQWPTYGGSASRDRLASGVKTLTPPTARYELPGGATRRAERVGGWDVNPWNSASREFMPVMPAVSDGVIVVNEGYSAWAADLVGGGERRLWTLPGLPASQLLFEERVLHGVTIDRGHAWFCIAQTAQDDKVELGWLTVVYPVPFRRLTCVEVQTGRVLWTRGGDASGRDFEKKASFHGAPVVDGDRVYCAATYWETSTSLIEHWIVCMDAATGETIWKTWLASGLQEINLFGNNTRESVPASLTLTRDRIFACTNLGIVGCLDRSDGGLVWARRYPRYPVKPVIDPYDIPRLPIGWLNNPIFAATDPRDGKLKVLVAPMDGPYLLCLSAEDGTLFWRFSCHDDETGTRRYRDDVRLRHILGVRDGVVYLSGREAVALSLSGAKNVWVPVRIESEPAGRGVLAADGVYIPTTGGLLKLGLRKPTEGKALLPWPARDLPGGNLILVDQALVTTSNDLLTVCYDPNKVKQFYEAEIERNPSSAYLKYRLALCLLQTGEADRAESVLKAALATASSRKDEDSQAIAEACRRTLFRNRIAAADRLILRSDGLPRAAEELEKARAFAASEDAWTELLFKLANVRRASGDDAKAVAALQEIIELHGDSLDERQEPSRVRARHAIDAILARAGRPPYDDFEKQAADLLTRARAAGDTALFEELLRRFPNALAAEDAACGVGSARFAASDWAGTCDAHSRFLRDYPSSKLSAQALAEMAVAYEKRLMWGLAGGALRKLKRSWGETEVRIEGGRVKAGKFAEARLAQEAYRGVEGAGAVPAVSFPAARKWSWSFQRGADSRVLTPQGARPWKTALVITTSGRSVFGLNADNGEEVWKAEAPRGSRWACWSSGLLVIAGDSAVHAYRESGELAWKTAFDGALLYFAREGEGTIFLSARNPAGTGSILAAFDAATGEKSWQIALQPNHHLREFWLLEDRVAWRSREETGMVLADRATGATRERYPLPASRVIPAGPDRFLILTPDNRLVLTDAASGKTLWSHPLSGMRFDDMIEVRGNVVVSALFEGETWRLRVISLETGKLLHDTDMNGMWLKRLLIDGDNAYVVFKDPGPPNPFVASAYQLSTGKKLWETKLEGAFLSMFPAVNASRHVILNCPTFDSKQREWTPVLLALDKDTGVESGRIQGRAAATPTYTVDLVPGRVLLTQDDSVEGWGR